MNIGIKHSADVRATQDDLAETAGKTIEVRIISDAICPWGFIAKRRFEQAVTQMPDDVTLSVHWQPFELNPNMPPEGMDRVEYRSRKFGSWEHSLKLDAQVAVVGAEEGIIFRHDLITRTPNTFNTHRLIWLAEQEGVQDAMVEAIFHAYFLAGQDIGEQRVLVDLGVAAGMSREKVAAFLQSDAGASAVSKAETIAYRQGVSGVPTFVIDGKPVFSSAVPTDLMLSHLLNTVESS
ncbi:MAG: DsbA family oxidoreductase [Chloroflexi bacterium AL-W]|nr:DsbA family oxidoreductase [Chloroflexi bacterium AL-N1]NOK71429.1 DsbA family oxidoreductase [Chloroflexi bacterium AL-N10]NOK78832.1 DsbA family oxidoreductase [Chloroflexi bacterium AL-N5]NOK86250.1 DsbA family oxidoreductase [Chloroflexi bacterium AL-W]NOK93154.1 DsbA family oxidoreductase [Chloroflexi bacterium AL-N15]